MTVLAQIYSHEAAACVYHMMNTPTPIGPERKLKTEPINIPFSLLYKYRKENPSPLSLLRLFAFLSGTERRASRAANSKRYESFDIK
ncbi:hypothetical protein YC2023_097409 [Brassica napus]